MDLTTATNKKDIGTLVIHEAPAELLEGSTIAHGPERTVELVVRHYQVFGVSGHVDYLRKQTTVIFTCV